MVLTGHAARHLSMPAADLLRLVEKVRRLGMQPKPELGIRFGAGGDSSA